MREAKYRDSKRLKNACSWRSYLYQNNQITSEYFAPDRRYRVRENSSKLWEEILKELIINIKRLKYFEQIFLLVFEPFVLVAMVQIYNKWLTGFSTVWTMVRRSMVRQNWRERDVYFSAARYEYRAVSTGTFKLSTPFCTHRSTRSDTHTHFSIVKGQGRYRSKWEYRRDAGVTSESADRLALIYIYIYIYKYGQWNRTNVRNSYSI